ncbi:hypothetical protein BGX38DRAFT_104848 [Terfezia claveryi]|nr:hypothetical protein BGX38DRAFT_104848 [Terfezia claveryi]
MITSTKNSSSCGSISKPSTNPSTNPDSTGTPAAAPTTNPSIPLGRTRASSSCTYLPILQGLSGPASPAEVTKEIAFGGVVDNSGKFSPRIVESEGGYFALRNTAVVGDRDREPASPRRITSTTSLVAAGTSGTIITRDCGWGEMVTGIETEGVGTVHHHYFYHHHRTSSGTYETPEELLLRVKTKASSSNLSFHQQLHQQPTTPIQRSPSSLSLSFTPTSAAAVSNNTVTSTVIGPPPSSSGLGSSNIPTSTATSSVSKTTAKPSIPRSSTRTSPKSSLRLRLPPPPKVQIDTLGIGVQHILLPHHPYHRFIPNTPDGRAYERRRESAPSLLVPGIHPRAGDWLLTPPEEVGGMLWHCTPSDNIDEMADRQEELEGDDAKSAKYACRPATSDGTLSHNRNAVSRKANLSAHVDVCKEKDGNKIVEEGEGGEEGQTEELWEDEDWGVGEEWLKGAAEVLLSSLSPVRVTQEAVRILSYTLPCPLPTAPDPAYVSVGASTTATHQGRLPASAKDAPGVAAMAGQELSAAITARCNSKRPNAGIIPIGSRDGVTTTIHTVTSAIQRRYGKQGAKRVYINVSHAIPPHIPLNRLPSIPPAPGSRSAGAGGNGLFDNPFGGSVSSEDGCYFAPTVFNSIVVAMGETPGPRLPGHLMSNPILPPNSLHFSLLERFIPPGSAADDAGMFSPTSSILVDRLVELHDNRGSLLFIYPTKTGAKQFVKNTLGPVLDPLLRKLMVLHTLPTDLLWRIRNMPAVDSMADWEDLKLRMENLVAALSRVTDGSLSIEVAYASTQQIRLNDESWREWWSQQEQMRIREIVKHHYASIANMLSRSERSILIHDHPTTPSVTIQNLSSFPFPHNAPAATPKPKPSPKKNTSSKPLGQKKGDSTRPTSIELPETQIFTPTFVTPMSPEASAHYLGIRSPNLPISPRPIPTTQTTSISPSSHSSSGFTMGYGPPGDLAREVIDGVRALAIRPSSKGMGEAVMASALAGSGGNTAVGQGMGGVVGEAVGRKEGAMNRDRPGESSWKSGAREGGLIEVGVFVLRRVRR